MTPPRYLQPVPNGEPHELPSMPSMPGSPARPLRSNPVRLGYACVSLLVGINGGSATCLSASIRRASRGDLGLTPTQICLVAGGLLMVNMTIKFDTHLERGGSMRATLFSGEGRLEAGVAIAIAQRDQTAYAYLATALSAFATSNRRASSNDPSGCTCKAEPFLRDIAPFRAQSLVLPRFLHEHADDCQPEILHQEGPHGLGRALAPDHRFAWRM